MSTTTIPSQDRIEIAAVLSLLYGIVTRVSYLLGLLSIFGQAARLFSVFDVLVELYRKIFYWIYGLVLPRHFADYKKDLITVGIFALALAAQYAFATYRDLAQKRAELNGQRDIALQIAKDKREAANSADGVVGGAIIGGILLGPIGALIGAAIGGALDGSKSDEADQAEARARTVDVQGKLQFDLALRAAALGLLRILAFSLVLGGLFFIAERNSAYIQYWLEIYDSWVATSYEHALRWLKHLVAR